MRLHIYRNTTIVTLNHLFNIHPNFTHLCSPLYTCHALALLYQQHLLIIVGNHPQPDFLPVKTVCTLENLFVFLAMRKLVSLQDKCNPLWSISIPSLMLTCTTVTLPILESIILHWYSTTGHMVRPGSWLLMVIIHTKLGNFLTTVSAMIFIQCVTPHTSDLFCQQ